VKLTVPASLSIIWQSGQRKRARGPERRQRRASMASAGGSYFRHDIRSPQ
jgi:hypothetical protein